MILKRAEIKNIKSYYPEAIIDFENDLNLFVGPNGGGKSNLFEIIQGVINNILYRHVTLKNNPNRRVLDHEHKNFTFILEYDAIDQTNLLSNLLDQHFNHTDEPSSIYLTFRITASDIDAVNNIKANKDTIVQTLRSKVAASQEIADLVDLLAPNTNFNFLKDRELRVFIAPPGNLNIDIADYSPFLSTRFANVTLFFKLLRILNSMYELSILFPSITFFPSSRYFGPNRQIDQPQSNVAINLSNMSSFEDSYTKGVNLTKESTPSLISGSQTKLCQLVEDGKTGVIKKYKDYLKRYLDLDIQINKIEDNKYITEYEVEYRRSSGVPMKLSSGEKEFFNLITGLILSGINNGIVLIDEPELHLHSQWQRTIQVLIFSLAKDFNIQFFIITHSPKFINELTIRKIFRIFKENSNSHVIQPTEPLGSTTKDLLFLLTTTNNEKAFFVSKVILVEGISDLLVISKAIDLIKKRLSVDLEIETIEVVGKRNLIKYRELLNRWIIENWIVADLDFLDQLYLGQITANDRHVEREIKSLRRKYPTLTGNFYNILSVMEKSSLIKKLFKYEHILILEKGTIENYFVPLRTPRTNKVEDALTVVSLMRYSSIDEEIRSKLKHIIR